MRLYYHPHILKRVMMYTWMRDELQLGHVPNILSLNCEGLVPNAQALGHIWEATQEVIAGHAS